MSTLGQTETTRTKQFSSALPQIADVIVDALNEFATLAPVGFMLVPAYVKLVCAGTVSPQRAPIWPTLNLHPLNFFIARSARRLRFALRV